MGHLPGVLMQEVFGIADAAGEVKLSVKNTSAVPVKVRLDLGIAKRPAQ